MFFFQMLLHDRGATVESGNQCDYTSYIIIL
jgi:hypothetical protein